MLSTKKSVLGIAFILLVFIWIFPSWIYVFDATVFPVKAKIGSSWLWDPPMPYGVALDWTKNLIYSLGVILAALGLCLWASLTNKS